MNELEVIERITKLEEKTEQQEKDIQTLKTIIDEIHSMSTNLAVMAQKMTSIDDDVKTLKDDMREIQEGPQEKWNTIVKTIITAVVSALVAYVIAKIS